MESRHLQAVTLLVGEHRVQSFGGMVHRGCTVGSRIHASGIHLSTSAYTMWLCRTIVLQCHIPIVYVQSV